MGMESMLYTYTTKEEFKIKEYIDQIDAKKESEGSYILTNDKDYYFEILLLDKKTLSMRFSVCSPIKSSMTKLFELMELFFNLQKGIFEDMYTYKQYDKINNSIQKELEQSFIKKRNIVLNNKKIEQITPTKNCLNLIANTKK